MASNPKTTFGDALNAQPVKPIQWAIVAVCMLVLVCDGIDLQLLGVVAPKVMEAFDVSRSTFGIAMMAALIGFGLGGWGGGWLGDAIGRRWTLVIAALVFSLGTMAAATSDGVWAMAFWRMFAGLGFGGAYANALAMAGEWLPDRWRPVTVSTLAVGTPIGGTIVGWIGPDLEAAYGWEGTFLIFGLATLLVVFVIWAVLRDSPSFLLARGRAEQAQENARLVLDDDVVLERDRHETDVADGPDIGVLHRSNLRLNLGIGIAFAASTLVAYGILSWGTTFLTAEDFTLNQAGEAVALAGISSMIGSILVGIVMRRFGSKIVMALLSAIMVVWMLAIGWTIEDLPATLDDGTRAYVTWLVGLSGFAFSASIAGMYVMMTHGYPPSCRSGGIGFGIFMSRVGAVSATGLGGWLLDLGGEGVWPFFGTLAAAAVLVSAAAFVVDRHVPPLGKTG
ncbi:MFS transporter [Aurantiacibacter hainanensis]|uniref:MFS transporter n=1 Tax=Aurantiacibacter hainanensis TaxID=3076114 RepID=UPI0030C6761A